MNKKVILATCTNQLWKSMKNSLKEFCRISEVMDCENEDELWKVLSDITDAETVIFFGKFFLGYIFEHKINELKYHHKKRTICFLKEETVIRILV